MLYYIMVSDFLFFSNSYSAILEDKVHLRYPVSICYLFLAYRNSLFYPVTSTYVTRYYLLLMFLLTNTRD